MKLIRIGKPGAEKPAVLTGENKYLDVSDRIEDYNESFFEEGGLDVVKEITDTGGNSHNLDPSIRLGPPLARPSKILCIGLNYSKHISESGMMLPREPVLFYKSTTAITGPDDHIIIPRGSKKTDWEVELAVVIGKRASYVSESEAMDYVAGYMLHNDISEREYQLEREGQWLKGKSADTFAPVGPWLVTKDEIRDPHTLDLWLKVNGVRHQSGNTSDMVFKVPNLVSYISQFMTLLPGDIISTGTPSGVGMGLKPPQYLKSGDVVELGITGLGEARQVVISYEETNRQAG